MKVDPGVGSKANQVVPRAWLATLACALFATGAAAGEAMIGPRGTVVPPEQLTPEMQEARREQMALDIRAWLPRLLGRFEIEGVFSALEVSRASGKADCIAIGDGAGLHCALYVTWQEQWTLDFRPVEGGVPFLGPASILFGVDPNGAKARYLLLNTNGVAESETGALRGNSMSFAFETHCESDATSDNPNQLCRRVMRFYAPPQARYISLTFEIEPWSVQRGTWGDPMTTLNVDLRHPPGTDQ